MNEFEFSNQTKNEETKSKSRIADLLGADQELELQSRIDDALVRRFELDDVALPDEFLSQLEQRQREVRSRIFNRRALLIVAAASLVGVLVFGSWQLISLDRSPLFQMQPLSSIYNECLESGFRPKQRCRGVGRVESVFLHQHGVALTMSELPADKNLIGVSHLGGVSRNTFAVLLQDRNSPAIVFIDKAEYHDPAVTDVPDGSELSVFSRFCGDFVIYEVSMVSEPRFLDFFEIPEPSQR